MIRLTLAVVASALAAATLPVKAHDNYRSSGKYTSYEDSQYYVKKLKARISRQEYRISHAWEQGRLDRNEKYRLVSKLKKIRDELRYACKDDHVSHYENRYIQRLLDSNSKRIVHYRYGYDNRRYSYKDYDGYRSDRYRSSRYQSRYGRYRNDY